MSGAALWNFLDDPHPLDGVPVAYCDGSTWVSDNQVEHVAEATVCDWWASPTNCYSGAIWYAEQFCPYGKNPECK